MGADDLLQQSLRARELPELSESVKLVARAREGDREAMGKLFARYQERVLRIVRVRLGDHLRPFLDSMDIVQETFQAAARDIERLEVRDHASILKWFAGIVRHRILDSRAYFYAQKRDRARELPILRHDELDVRGLQESGVADSDGSPLGHCSRSEVVEIVDEAVGRLPEHYREVIVQRDYCERSWSDVARELDCVSTPAARELHRRAVVKLATLVGERLGDAD